MAWKGDSRRHSLSRKGIKTNIDQGRRFDVSNFVAKGTIDNELIRMYDKQIIEALERTHETGLEHGFSVCKDDEGGSFISRYERQEGDLCVGEECHVQLAGCSEGNFLMEFHTHPETITLFSGVDIHRALRTRTDFTCIGINQLDPYMEERFPDSDVVTKFKDKATVTCWKLIKNPDGSVADQKSLEEWDRYYVIDPERFDEWFTNLHRKVNRGESGLFEASRYEINLKTGEIIEK